MSGSRACNDVANEGPLVVPVIVRQAAPAATGGPLEDGVFQLFDATVYAVDGGFDAPMDTLRATLVLDGVHSESVIETLGGPTLRVSSRLSVAGVVVTRVDSCPVSGATRSYRYRSEPGLFAYYVDYGAVVQVLSFRRVGPPRGA